MIRAIWKFITGSREVKPVTKQTVPFKHIVGAVGAKSRDAAYKTSS